MKREEASFDGNGGILIYWQAWLPEGEPVASVVIAHGMGEHSGRYARVAQFLVDAGYAVYAIDHRGHGKSGGDRALVDSFARTTADIDTLVDLVRVRWPRQRLFLLGHSLGGALSLSYALAHQNKLSGLILSGPAVALAGASKIELFMGKLLSKLTPKLGLLRVDPAQISRDPSEVQTYNVDPLNFHGKVPARTLGEIIDFVEHLPTQLHKITLPLLIMHGTDDKLAGIAGSEMVFERVQSRDKTLHRYEGLYHEIFNELPRDRERVLNDLRAWLAAHRG